MKLSERWTQLGNRPVVFPAVFRSAALGVTGLLLASCSSSLPNSYEANLADHLSESGATMYGAYWCPHCAIQKDYFGGAVNRIPYVECDPEGIDNESERCVQMGITAYPTWVIDGEYYLGTQPLITLEKLSGFEGAVATERDKRSSGSMSPAN
ncbi:MAG: glutaredoxin family protein [Phormidesmis sp.]